MRTCNLQLTVSKQCPKFAFVTKQRNRTAKAPLFSFSEAQKGTLYARGQSTIGRRGLRRLRQNEN